MNEQLSEIVDESIKLELNIETLYKYFSTIYPEDTDFWQKLCSEEEQHASLIKGERDVILSNDGFPSELLSPTLNALIGANNKLISLLKEFKDKSPSRESALNIAKSLEKSAGEIHFQREMNKRPASEYMKLFHMLNKDDMDHAQRIDEYMISLGIGYY